MRRRNRGPSSRIELWLAEERNFIPVRYFEYKFMWSKHVPDAKAIVEDWHQIAPGVWFPVSVTIIKYNGPALKREQTLKLQWREHYDVKRVSLEPDHEKAFFQELPGSR